MSALVFLFVGLMTGYGASKLPVNLGLGFYGDLIAGTVGAFIGGLSSVQILGEAYSFQGATLLSISGAVFLLFIEKLFGSGSHSANVKT